MLTKMGPRDLFFAILRATSSKSCPKSIREGCLGGLAQHLMKIPCAAHVPPRCKGHRRMWDSQCEFRAVIQPKNGSKSFGTRRCSHYREHTLLKLLNKSSESLKSNFRCSKSTAGASKIDPWAVQNRPSDPKDAHDRPKIAPRVPQKHPESAPERP